ncbi:hypothetical protein L1887_45869 [Cichorium endivia]|nr:hypothetical protein L1887_45869 [Cichorium endivia]
MSLFSESSRNVVQERASTDDSKANGEFILIAGHNLSGPNEASVIKYNIKNGWSTPKGVTAYDMLIPRYKTENTNSLCQRYKACMSIKSERSTSEGVYREVFGQVRNINFPFYLESDTAHTIAIEMVEQLDLIHEDVLYLIFNTSNMELDTSNSDTRGNISENCFIEEVIQCKMSQETINSSVCQFTTDNFIWLFTNFFPNSSSSFLIGMRVFMMRGTIDINGQSFVSSLMKPSILKAYSLTNPSEGKSTHLFHISLHSSISDFFYWRIDSDKGLQEKNAGA